MSRPSWRRLPALLAAALLAISGVALVAEAPIASAAAQNGYVFNDAWQLQNPGSTRTNDSAESDATNSATSSLPTSTGAIGITARFAPGGDQRAGTNYLTNGTNQSGYGGSAGMFAGAPTPGNLPALGVLTGASTCGGAQGTAAHQNFAGSCEVGTLTLEFSKPVTDPVLDISGLGGFVQRNSNGRARGSFNATIWEIETPGVSFAAPSAGRTNLAVGSTTLGPGVYNTFTRCDQDGHQEQSGNIASPRMTTAGCGSVVLQGTFTSVTFRLDSHVTPYSTFPASTHGTGSLYSQNINGDQYADGVNGYNVNLTEQAVLPGRATGSRNSDMQRVSLRLPTPGVIGDRVWSDTNGDGIQDEGEPGLAGATVELLDGDGNPVTDANGNPITATTGADGAYRFTDLPLGDYRVRFTAPDGREFSPTGAGDPASDSDAGEGGLSGVITLTSEQPEDLTVDAGVVPPRPTASPDTSSGPQGARQTVDPLVNDDGDGQGSTLDPSTLTLLDAAGEPADAVTVYDAEGNEIGTYTIDRSDPDRPLIAFQPVPTFTGEAPPVDYRIADSNGRTAESTYTPTVTPVTPTAQPDETSGPQGQAQSVDPFVNDAPGDDSAPLVRSSLTLLDGPDGDPVDAVTVRDDEGNEIGTYTIDRSDPDNPRIVFQPVPSFTGTAPAVDYRIEDANGTPATSTYTPTIEPVTPQANPDETSGPQGAEQSVDPFTNDEAGDDAVPLDRDSLTLLDDAGNPVDSVTVPGEGTYTVRDGKLVFQPEPGFTGEATPVRYQVADVNGTTADSTYTPTVGAVANPDVTSGPQGVPQRVDPLANDGTDEVSLDPDTLTLVDADGNPVDSVTVEGEGTYTIEDGQIVFTPEPDFTGEATPVRYQVKDTEGNTVESTYTPTLDPVTPVANPDSTSGPQGVPQSIDPFANDEPGDPAVPLDRDSLTLLDGAGNPVSTVSVPGEGVYTVEDGKIVFTPEPDFTGTATPVDYRIADVNGTTADSTYTPTLNPVSPTANPDVSSGPQGAEQSVDPFANDEPGDEDVPLDPESLTLLDADGNPVDEVVVPGEGTYTVRDGKLVFQPEPGFSGEATPVRYQVADVNGTTADSTYTPTVGAVANPDVTSGPQGVPQRVDPLANDGTDEVSLDPDTLTLVDADGNPVDSVTVEGQGVYTIEDGQIVFTPEPDFVGEATPVRYQVKDTEGNTVESTYTPTLNPVTPVANPDTTSGPQGVPQSIDPFANDEPGDDAVPLDPESLTLLDAEGNPTDRVEVPGEGVYTVEDGKIVFTPEPDFTGTATPVDYRIADVNGTTADSTYTPTLNPVTPVANPDTTSGPQGVPQSTDPFANDEPGDDAVPLDPESLTLLDAEGNPVDSVTIDGEGVYTVEGGKIVFTPEPQFTGTATPVDYRIADVNGTTADSTYTPTIDPVAPVANPDTTSGPQGAKQTVDPFANDEPGDDNVPLDRDSLTLLDAEGNPVDSVTIPGEGTYTVEGDKIVFTPEPQFTGEATPVDYRIADVNGTTADSTYTPTVTPVAQPDTTSGPQGVPQSVDPLANDSAEGVELDPDTLTLVDADGNPVDELVVPGEGSYTIEDGKIVFTPEPQFTGEGTPVRYQVKDSEGNTVESTYTPTVTPVTPTANPDTTSGPQGVPQSTDPFANDEAGDPAVPLDPDSLTLLDAEGNPVESVTIPGEGTYTVADGRIVFTPEPQFTGTATPVDYRIADVNGTTAESTYTPTIDPVTPVANPDKTSGPQGVPQSIDPLANDEAGDPAVPLDPDSLTLLDAEGNPADSVTVPGEGTYTIEDGKIVFTPEPQFTGTATPVDYRIADVNGTTARSTYTPTIDPVTPTASPDKTSGPKGKPQSIDPLANDKAGDPAVPLDPSSLTLLDKDGNPVDTVTVPGEGVYTIEDGKIVFTPEPDFTGTATPVRYRVADVNGTTTESTYTPTVLPDAPVPGEPGPGEPSKPGKPGKSAKPGTPGTPGTTAKNGDLPATGSEVSPALLGLGVAALVGGLLFTWVGRRRNRA
ncbi:Ig-like domain-containing protein [Pimelobacter simplex]|uniref:Ig-like domain-containing protein n=1 Tax=Nocardioides simplex TaxID=2045 RepID=UPI001143501C|nr:Ig-like domain-containing protein [Pimelobacter simplex]GEB16923.1 hypothetical protein NSI01_52380 [Pimelobacter simplex]